MAELRYRRLTRSRARSLFGVISTSRSSLWLGPDHVLCIDTTGYTEKYKRFHFRDIQAIVIRRTNSWKVAGLVFGLIALLFGLIALASGEPVVAWIFGPLASLFVLAFIFNLAAGPSCTTYLRTAVQTEHLVSLKRVRRTRRVIDRLRPVIAEAQGQMTPEETRARSRPGTANSPMATATNPTEEQRIAPQTAVPTTESPPQSGEAQSSATESSNAA